MAELEKRGAGAIDKSKQTQTSGRRWKMSGANRLRVKTRRHEIRLRCWRLVNDWRLSRPHGRFPTWQHKTRLLYFNPPTTTTRFSASSSHLLSIYTRGWWKTTKHGRKSEKKNKMCVSVCVCGRSEQTSVARLLFSSLGVWAKLLYMCTTIYTR
jgi:hypothetical protein